MSQNDREESPFDKNLRSLLDAVAMFEREAGLVLDRFGVDSETISRVMDLVGSLSAEAVRPLAAALGIADAATVESLARDVRAMLQNEARMRREQSATASRVDDLLRALEELGGATARLADLQTRTQDRLEALVERAAAAEGGEDQRRRLAEELAGLRSRIDALEGTLATELGIAVGGRTKTENDAGIRPAGARRATPRTVSPTSSSQKILEGLPVLEPKVRPA